MVRPETLRQTLVVTSLIFCTFCDGYILGQMSGMLSNLQSKESDIEATDEEISWIASIINVACFIGYGVAVVVCEKFGRKLSVTILTTPIIISWLMLYYAQSVIVILLSRVVVGISFGGVIYLSFLMTAEYTSPNVRGLCLNMVNSVGLALGTGVGHILGILFHWRTTALIGIIPSVITILLPFFWQESPSWLASEGRFEECQEAFRAIRGRSEASEKELQLLVAMEKSKRMNSPNEREITISPLKLIFQSTTKKYFWKIMFTIFVIGVFRTAGGKVLFGTFGITILQDITGKPNILLYTILVDALMLAGPVLSCILLSRMKMRTLLFPSAILAIVLLLVLCGCLYFKPENERSYFPWINSGLLGLHFIALNAGPYPLIEAIIGELFPLEIKSVMLLILGLWNGVLVFLTIKLAPTMFLFMGYHGVFLLNAILISACILYFWIFLPETKGRTLQEIELYLKTNKFCEENDLIDGEQMKVLINNK